MSPYVNLLVVFVLGVLAIAALYLAARQTTLPGAPLVALPFLSGMPPAEHALSRYHARYYSMTLVFLAFDVEMLFMYPWAVVAVQEGIGSVVEMFGFLAILMVGVAWAWREGALRWA